MALTPIGGEIQHQLLNDNFSYLESAKMTNIVFNVATYGAIGDGSDESVPILDAITDASVHGGVVVFPWGVSGVYGYSSGIVIGNGTSSAGATKGNNVYLKGLTGGAGVNFAANGTGVTLKWLGAAGGTMLKWLGALAGGGSDGIALDGNNLAAYGLIVNHMVGGQFPLTEVKGCTDTAVLLTTQTVATSLGGCADNKFGIMRLLLPAGAKGLVLDGSIASGWIVLQNKFDIVDIAMAGTNNIGMELGYCDFNHFGIVDIFNLNALSGTVGLKLVGKGPVGQTIWPAYNSFDLLAASGGVSSDTTAGTPNTNFVALYDTSDSGGIPNVTGLCGYVAAVNVLVPFGIGSSPTIVSQADNLPLTTTAITTFIGPYIPGLYEISAYIRVTGATTSVTAVAQGQDESAIAQYFLQGYDNDGSGTLIKMASASLPVGSYTCLNMTVRIITSTAPFLLITAGTANQVYVSATMRKISG